MRVPFLALLLLALGPSLVQAHDGAAIAVAVILVGIVALCVLTCCARPTTPCPKSFTRKRS